MSFQWTVVAGFVYAEIGTIVLMMLPWIRPQIWSRFFKSRFVHKLKAFAWVYSYALFGILILLFLDAIREVRKYSNVDLTTDIKAHMAPQADTLVHMRLFRAQRNLYLSGFALFLYMVIRRMIQLIMYEAQLVASADASLKQASNASSMAEKILNEKPLETGTKKGNALEKEIATLRNQLKSAENDRDAMREQAQGLKREYDRLMKDFDHLQQLAEDVDEKKSD